MTMLIAGGDGNGVPRACALAAHSLEPSSRDGKQRRGPEIGLRSRQEGGSLARFQSRIQETRFSSKVWSRMGLESQERKSEPESVGEEDYRFQR